MAGVGLEPTDVCPSAYLSPTELPAIFRTDGLNFTHRHFSQNRAIIELGGKNENDRKWWDIKESNLGPTGYEPVALTN